jgi:hypothetical protein
VQQRTQGGRQHIGDEHVTYNRRKEGRPRSNFPPFSPSLEEEEEAHREVERRAEREAEREGEKMLGDTYERPEGSGRPPWTQMQPSCRYSAIW